MIDITELKSLNSLDLLTLMTTKHNTKMFKTILISYISHNLQENSL